MKFQFNEISLIMHKENIKTVVAGDIPHTESTPRLGAYVDFLLGRKLRNLRKDKGLTLKELSHRSGLSVGNLSQIERGVTSASLRSITALSVALDVPIDHILENIEGMKSEASGYVVHAENQLAITVEDQKITKHVVTPKNAQFLDLYTCCMEPGGNTGADMFVTDTDEIVGYIIEGYLELHLGKEKQILKAGDSFCYPGSMPRRWSNPGPGNNRVVYAAKRKNK